MPKNYYSTAEVAKILRTSRISVFNKIKSGKIKAEKIGRNYIINHGALLEALGKVIGPENKSDIEKAIDKALQDYGKTFRLLGKGDET